MRTADAEILIVPGLNNSGPDHWQTRWQQKLSTAQRVEQRNWDQPDHAAWTRTIADRVNAAKKPVILIAHSLGVAAAAHAAPLFEKDRGKGAFLVAPPSEEWLRTHEMNFGAFETHPRDPLHFPSLLVGSRNDPHASYAALEELAFAWGSAFKDAGEAGHINSESGHGPWPEGLMSLAAFLARL